MPQTTQFDTSINLLCLVHLMLELCFQCFSYNLHNMFPLFLYEAKSDNVTQSNSIYYDQLIRRFFDVAKNINQSYNLTHYIVFAYFFLQKNFIFYLALVFAWLK